MATISEDIQSRQTTLWPPTQERIYHIVDTSDEAAALALLIATSPTEVEVEGIEIIRGLRSINPIWVDDASDKGVWTGHVKYVLPRAGPPPPGGVYTFDTTGGTKHIFQSRQTVGVYGKPGTTPPNFGGAINVTQDSVEGTTVVSPMYAWTELHHFLDLQITETYKKTLASLGGMVNAEPFRGFDPLEVMFNGATGSKRGEDNWEITFNFARRENESGIVIGDITGIGKKGWDVLWVWYTLQEDPAASRVLRKPLAVYVERVALSGNFSLLNTGG